MQRKKQSSFLIILLEKGTFTVSNKQRYLLKNKTLMTNEKSILKKWLDKLQEESWNLELLISGFSIFGLFKAKEFLEDKGALFFANDIVNGSLMDKFQAFFIMVYASVFIFIVFLLLHIFFRGLWIGAIGIRYVSGDIDYTKLNYNSTITNYLKKKIGSFDDYILKLEKISSIIFGYTFLLILFLCSIYFYLVFTTFVVNGFDQLLGDTFFWWLPGFILPILMIVLGIFAAVDFITGGVLKMIKFKLFKKPYIICSKVISWITLSFLWKPIYYNLVDNKKTKWLIYFIIPIFAFLYLQSTINYNSFSIFPSKLNSDVDREFKSISFKEKARYSFQTKFYDNLRKKNEVIRIMSLQNNKIENKSMELFVKLYNYDETLIMKMDSTIKPIAAKGLSSHLIKKSDYENELLLRRKEESHLDYSYYKKEQKLFRESLDNILQSAKKLYSIRINEIPVNKDSIDILFHKHINQNEEGFLLLFPIENVKKGMNLITLEKLVYDRYKDKYDTLDFTIPFVYSKH